MTALSFPPSPDTGAIYEAPNNTVYIYDGQKWNVQGTTVTSAATVNFIQDSIAPIFTNIQGSGISFSYNNETNELSATVSGGGGISISDFGDGFSLNNADKIVTRKLYSTNDSDSNVHYRLELTTGGTIKLPDQSEIIGSTLKGIHGTGELNYTGMTIGPNSGNSENTWIWIDASNAYIATDYADTQKIWTFDSSGSLTLPFGGVIKNNDGTNILDGLGGGTSSNTGDWSFTNKTATSDGNIVVKAGAETGSRSSLLSHDGDNSLWVDNNGAHVTSDLSDTENNWTFSRDGSTQFPNYTFPSEHGSSGQILKDNGNGTLSWGYADRLKSGEYTVSLNSITGIVSVPRGIRFDDTTYQTTAWTGSNPIDYANIVNIPIPPDADIDGGHALAYFNIPSSADGGGSSQRFGPNSTVFNGGGASGTYTNTLDGGGA